MKTRRISTLCLCWILVSGLANVAPAQVQQQLTKPQVPLEQVLNPDGTLDLKRGFQGSLDPSLTHSGLFCLNKETARVRS